MQHSSDQRAGLASPGTSLQQERTSFDRRRSRLTGIESQLLGLTAFGWGSIVSLSLSLILMLIKLRREHCAAELRYDHTVRQPRLRRDRARIMSIDVIGAPQHAGRKQEFTGEHIRL